jgi:hypothetical protein
MSADVNAWSEEHRSAWQTYESVGSVWTVDVTCAEGARVATVEIGTSIPGDFSLLTPTGPGCDDPPTVTGSTRVALSDPSIGELADDAATILYGGGGAKFSRSQDAYAFDITAAPGGALSGTLRPSNAAARTASTTIEITQGCTLTNWREVP